MALVLLGSVLSFELLTTLFDRTPGDASAKRFATAWSSACALRSPPREHDPAGPLQYGVGTSTGMIAYQSTLQAEVPDRLRGRTFALFDVLGHAQRNRRAARERECSSVWPPPSVGERQPAQRSPPTKVDI